MTIRNSKVVEYSDEVTLGLGTNIRVKFEIDGVNREATLVLRRPSMPVTTTTTTLFMVHAQRMREMQKRIEAEESFSLDELRDLTGPFEELATTCVQHITDVAGINFEGDRNWKDLTVTEQLEVALKFEDIFIYPVLARITKRVDEEVAGK